MNLVLSRVRAAVVGCSAFVAVSAAAPCASAQSSQPSGEAPEAGNPPLTQTSIFPLMGKSAAARGIKMPLPFGVGLNYAFAEQPIDITKLAVGVNGSDPVDLTDVIVFDNLRSQVHAMNARVDMWLFPFLNIYGMGNYIIQSTTTVGISEPFAFEAGAVQPGAGGGFGGTFAAGVWGFFATVDVNWSWNKMQNLEAPVATYLLTPRIGRNFGKIWGIETAVWVGAMRQTIASETKGDIHLSDAIGGGSTDGFKQQVADWYADLPPARQAVVRGLVGQIENSEDPVIHYELDKSIASPWNMLIGTELGLTPAWRLRAEVGFINRTQVVLGFNYRFGAGSTPEAIKP